LLQEIATHDPLTGLPNRILFDARLTHALEECRRNNYAGLKNMVQVIIMDVDDFKHVNDLFGHLIGDEVLKEIGQRLRAEVRASDTVARWGGDEFVILTIGSRDESVSLIIERINKSVDGYTAQSDKPYKLACSIGFTSVDVDDGENLEGIIAEADKAMYAEKRLRKVKSYKQAERSQSF